MGILSVHRYKLRLGLLWVRDLDSWLDLMMVNDLLSV